MPLRFPWSKADPTGDTSLGMAKALKRIEEARREGSTVLNLSYLDLTTLPEALGRLHALTLLFLHDNPALGLPAEALGPTGWRMASTRCCARTSSWTSRSRPMRC